MGVSNGPPLEEGLIFTLMFVLSRSVTWPSFVPQSEGARNATSGHSKQCLLHTSGSSSNTGNPVVTEGEDLKQRGIWCMGDSLQPHQKETSKDAFFYFAESEIKT